MQAFPGRMGRRFARGAHPAARVSTAVVALLLCAGFVVGGVSGWILMASTHTVMELRATPAAGSGVRLLQEGSDAVNSPALDQSNGASERMIMEEIKERLLAARAKAKSEGTHTRSRTRKRSNTAAADPSSPWPTHGDTVHVVVTSGGGPYQNFQTRITYASFLMVQQQPGGDKMAAFTRILHRMTDDELMQEVPTFRATPLQPDCDQWCDYPVSDRPNAVQQFLDAAKEDPSLIQAPWILMGECDYTWITPVQPPPAESSQLSQAFPFGYIDPRYPTITHIMRRFYPESAGPLTDIPNTGPAPALLRVQQWAQLVPRWEELTAAVEEDEEAKDKLDWIREMYAFSLACALERIELDLQLPPRNKLMIQPPADHGMGAAALMHYTWGGQFNDSRGEVWHWDKRDHSEQKDVLNPPLLPEVPPFQQGWTLQDGVPVSEELYATTVLMVETMNEAIRRLKPLQKS